MFHSCEKVGLFGVAGDLHALELGIEPDVDVQIASILMEMKQCTVGSREAAALALPQLRQLAQLRQQRLKLIKVFPRCMPHASSMPLDAWTSQEPTLTGRSLGFAASGGGMPVAPGTYAACQNGYAVVCKQQTGLPANRVTT